MKQNTWLRVWLIVGFLAAVLAQIAGADERPKFERIALSENYAKEQAEKVENVNGLTPIVETIAVRDDNSVEIIGPTIIGPVEKHRGVYVTAEYLRFKARRGGYDFAITSTVQPANLLPAGNLQSLSLPYDNGYKIGVGYDFANGLRLGGEYTYFHTSGARSLTAQPGQQLFQTLLAPAVAGALVFPNTASATANLDYDVVDLSASGDVYANGPFALRMFGGPRLAWIDQKFNVAYNGGQFASTAQVGNRVDFSSYGLRVGGTTEWRIGAGENLRLYATAAGSLMAGQFNSHIFQSSSTGNLDVQEKMNDAIPVTELGVGAAWRWTHFSFGLGYRLTTWYGMYQRRVFVDDTAPGVSTIERGNLMLDGLFLEAGLYR